MFWKSLNNRIFAVRDKIPEIEERLCAPPFIFRILSFNHLTPGLEV